MMKKVEVASNVFVFSLIHSIHPAADFLAGKRQTEQDNLFAGAQVFFVIFSIVNLLHCMAKQGGRFRF
jgi:hypothetical protein